MDLTRKAFEAVTTLCLNTSCSLLEAALVKSDWETAMTILHLSPRKLDAFIALSLNGGEAILDSVKDFHNVNGAEDVIHCEDGHADYLYWKNEKLRKRELGQGRRCGDKVAMETDHDAATSDSDVDMDGVYDYEESSLTSKAKTIPGSRTSPQKNFKNSNYGSGLPIKKKDILQRCRVMTYLTEARNVLDGNSVIHLAARNGSVYHLERLINLGADIEQTSRNPQDNNATPLLSACTSNESKVVEFLLSQGADANAKNSEGMNALHLAASSGRADNVELLVNRGLDIEASTASWKTALHLAAEGDKIEVMMILLKLGANVEARDLSKETPLILAVKGGCARAVECLLKHHCDFHVKARFDETPMHIVSKTGHVRIMQLLVRHEANVNAKNRAGKTPLMVAASQKGNSKAVAFLLENGCSVKETDVFGRSALHLASDEEIARILVNNGADPNLKDLNRQTALSMATFSRNTETAKFLIDAGSNLDWRDVFGNTALHYAVEECLVGLSTHLINQGASVQFQNLYGETPVDMAIRYNNIPMIDLFNAHSDLWVEAQCMTSRTP